MPLSEYEQRVLDQLEQELGQDPSLHRAMSKGPRTPARVIAAVAGVVVGLGIVLVGMVTQTPIVGIAGFAVMVGVALWALLAPRKGKGTGSAAPQAAPRGRKPSTPSAAPKPKKDFMQRFEERFERRRERGDF